MLSNAAYGDMRSKSGALICFTSWCLTALLHQGYNMDSLELIVMHCAWDVFSHLLSCWVFSWSFGTSAQEKKKNVRHGYLWLLHKLNTETKITLKLDLTQKVGEWKHGMDSESTWQIYFSYSEFISTTLCMVAGGILFFCLFNLVSGCSFLILEHNLLLPQSC